MSCVICGSPVPTASTGVTCNRSCRARLREQRRTVEWRKPRDYPAEIIELARHLYVDQGMTVAEVRAVFPKGYRVQTILERYLPARRARAKRDQSGERNHMWRGDAAGYKALHLRVRAVRGAPEVCRECDGPAAEWANLTGQYADVDDYAPMCCSCHRFYDVRRRALTGERTIPAALRGGGANV